MGFRKASSWQPAEPDEAQPADDAAGGPAPALEERLETLLHSERESQELLDELRAERWAAQQRDSEHRIAAIEAALAEAKREAGVRQDLERKLAQLRIEIVRLTNELDAAERRAADAARGAAEPSPPATVAGSVVAESPQVPAPVGRRGRFRRRRERGATVTCRICKRAREPAHAGGWIATADAAVCPGCQADGWQLAAGGGLPFRRSADRALSA
jgi:hypothetical protein